MMSNVDVFSFSLLVCSEPAEEKEEILGFFL